ncbi:MAG: zinc-ribbon domain containing protein, partial [Petrotogales bacterium]
LGIVESRRYTVLEDIKIKCVRCGKIFVFTGSEQKWYQKRGLSQPKRCPSCIEERTYGRFLETGNEHKTPSSLV